MLNVSRLYNQTHSNPIRTPYVACQLFTIACFRLYFFSPIFVIAATHYFTNFGNWRAKKNTLSMCCMLNGLWSIPDTMFAIKYMNIFETNDAETTNEISYMASSHSFSIWTITICISFLNSFASSFTMKPKESNADETESRMHNVFTKKIEKIFRSLIQYTYVKIWIFEEQTHRI